MPVQLGVSSLVHLAHPALADEGGDVVMPESGADGERHGDRVWSQSFSARCVENHSTVALM